jgi:NDP-sugar pyrophosphorylase family protein
MKAMILAAGLGTRMRPLTEHCPKPLLPLLLEPILGHLLTQLQHYGIREVVMNLHHQADQLARWLGDGSRWGMHMTLSVEEELLGTAGALKRVEALFHEAPFLVVNADVLMDVDLHALWHWHCARQAMVTMVLRPDAAARSYGPVLVDDTARVQLINGRPTTHQPATGEETIFTGMQVVDPRVLARIPPDGFCTTTGEVYPALLADQQAVYGYRYTGYWMDIGVPERYRAAHWHVLDNALGEGWQQHLPAGSRVLRHVDEARGVAPGLTLVPPVVLGPGVALEADVHLGPYVVLGAGCRLETGAVVRDSVLWDEVHVGAQAQVEGCVLGSGVHVPAAQQLHQTVQSLARWDTQGIQSRNA